MYYQKEEENEEEVSQNQSSEEFRVLTENNQKLKNEISFQKDSINHDSDKKILIYNDKSNKNSFELFKKEEKKEIQSLKKEKEKENIELINENKNNKQNINYEHNNFNGKYHPIDLNLEYKKYDQNEEERNIFNELNLDNDNKNKNISSNYNLYKEKKNTPHFNLSEIKNLGNEDYINNLVDNKNNKKENEKININKIYNDEKSNDYNKNSYNEEKYNNLNENYKNYNENTIIEKNGKNNQINEDYKLYLNKDKNLIKKEYKNNEENIFIENKNDEKDYKNEKQINKNDKLIYKINEENNFEKSQKNNNFYYFNYDNSINLRNYYPGKSGKTDYSTEQNTINKNHGDYKNSIISDFMEIQSKTIEQNKNITEKNFKEKNNKKSQKDYSNNFVNNLENELNIYNNLYIDNNETKEINKNLQKEKYINDINNVNIYNNYEKNKIHINSEKIKNNYEKIPEINNNTIELSKNVSNVNTERSLLYNQNIENNENISYREYENIMKNPESNIITKNYNSENTKRTMNDDSMNLNTLESSTIRKIDEEEEKIAVEIEKETKKLNELEQEKMKLILEEQDRRQKILEEIERQESKEKERKKKMRQKYEESIRKKREDEEKLRQIKIEQERQRKEINELIYKRKMDEEKILLLAEGKLDRQQRKNYRNLIKNETYHNKIYKNKLPFDIFINDKNNFDNKENILKKMKTNYIDKNFKFWNYEENNDNITKNGFRKHNNKNKKISYDNLANKLFRNFNNLNNNENTINNDKINYNLKNRNEKISINTITKLNKYMSFSPTSNHQKISYSLSPLNDTEKNNLNTELHQNISLSPHLFDEQKETLKEKNSNIEYINSNIKNTLEENVKTLYQKKLKKNYKNVNINIHKHIDNLYDKKNPDNKNIKNTKLRDIPEINKDEKKTIINRNSFTELKEIKEMTSKMANEINKKIETINKNQKILKAKSTPKFNPYIKNNKSSANNRLNRDNKNFKNEKELKNKEENKFIKLVKESKIELSDIINNNIDKEEKKLTKQKSFIEDYLLPSDIKKECLIELNKLEKNGKKSKDNFENNIGIYATTREHKISAYKTYENINKNKRGKNYKNEKYETNKENRNYNIDNQKTYYKEFLYGSDKGSSVMNYFSENNSRFLPYYKETYV